MIAKSGDLAALLTNLEDGDVLFIDEIHRLAPAVEEILYPAMEDRALDLMIGEGPSARSVRIDLPKFTLVGATTRQGLITTPLRDRFGIPVRLNFYTVEELEQVVRRAARLLGLALTEDGAQRGRPPLARHAAHRRAAAAPGARLRPGGRAMPRSTPRSPMRALTRMEVDQLGLDAMDRRYLTMIADIYKGGPVGVETLAAGLSEPRDTIEEVIEPYLIQLGLVARTARGRCLNGPAWTHLGLPQPKAARPACSTANEGDEMKKTILLSLLAVRRRARPSQAARRPAPVRRRARGRARSIMPTRPTGSACPAATTPARGRCRPPRSSPSGYGAGRPQRRRPPTRRSTASTSIRPCRATRPQQRPFAGHRGAGRRRRPVRALRQRLPALRAGLPPGDRGRDPARAAAARIRRRSSTLAYGDVARRLAPLSASITTMAGRSS